MTRRPILTNQSFWTKTAAELNFIMHDASEAASAMRGHNSKAESKYLDQALDAMTVLRYRQQQEALRKMPI